MRSLAVCMISLSVATSSEAAWRWTNPRPLDSELRGVAYSEPLSLFLAVGEQARACTSSDGVLWTTRDTGAGQALNAVAWSDGQFVAVGDDGTVLTSPDAAAWAQRVSNTSDDLLAIAAGAGRWVAVGRSHTVLVSLDGRRWEDVSIDLAIGDIQSSAYDLRGVTWNGAQFLAVGERGFVHSSLDGVTWQFNGLVSPYLAGGNHLESVTWDGQRYIAVGRRWMGAAGELREASLYTSEDGTNWSFHATVPRDLYGVVTRSGRTVAVGEAATLVTSVDAVDWELAPKDGSVESSSVSGLTLYAAAASAQVFVAVGAGGNVLRSSDGRIWSAPNPDPRHTAVAANETGLLVAVGAGGSIRTSADGLSWNDERSPTTHDLADIVWDGTRFYAVGARRTVLSSADGRDWLVEQHGTFSDLERVAWNGTRHAAVGAAGTILTSDDGVEWLVQISSVREDLRDIAWGAGRFVAVGQAGAVVHSRDGRAWQPASRRTAAELRAVVWSGSQFIAAGRAGTILTSSDGIEWTSRSSGTDLDLLAVAWDGRRCLAVGHDGASGVVISSPDGISWTAVAGNLRWSQLPYSIAWNGQRLLLLVMQGASAHEVLTSTDAVTWTNNLGTYFDPDPLPVFSASPGRSPAVFAQGGQFIVIRDHQTLLRSADAASWTSTTTAHALRGIAWTNAQFVGVGDAGAAATSADAAVWALRSFDIRGAVVEREATTPLLFIHDDHWSEIESDGAVWIAAGSDGTIGRRAVGDESWSYTRPTNERLRAVASNGSRWIVVGDHGTVLSSDDGATWTLRSSGLEAELLAVTWSGGEFHAVGADGAVVRSADGEQWTSDPLAVPYRLVDAIPYPDRVLVLGERWSIFLHEPSTGEQPSAEATIRVEGDLVFGDVPVGRSAERILTIHNDGSALLTVTRIELPERFTGAWSGTIAAGGSADVEVLFEPTAPQRYQGAVVVMSNAARGSGRMEVTGIGVVSSDGPRDPEPPAPTPADLAEDSRPSSGGGCSSGGGEPAGTLMLSMLLPLVLLGVKRRCWLRQRSAARPA